MSDGASGWTATSLQEIEAVPWPGGLTWRPVRAALGLRAFGAGGYTAEHAGDVVVEPHSELADGREHQELYVVLAGRATFVLDGQELDAPAGTLVFVREPGVLRAAVAAEDGTAVLALGGPPVFEPAGSEWLMRARPLIESDPAAARRLLDDGLREVPGSAAIPYGLALLEASQGNRERALESLRTAVAREPCLREEAASEPRLSALLGELGAGGSG